MCFRNFRRGAGVHEACVRAVWGSPVLAVRAVWAAQCLQCESSVGQPSACSESSVGCPVLAVRAVWGSPVLAVSAVWGSPVLAVRAVWGSSESSVGQPSACSVSSRSGEEGTLDVHGCVHGSWVLLDCGDRGDPYGKVWGNCDH